jgi:hypothetical protein
MAKSSKQQLISKIELESALERLKQNSDFKKVFIEYYLGEYKDILAGYITSATVGTHERATAVETLAGIANFKLHFFGTHAVDSEISMMAEDERNPKSESNEAGKVPGGF